MEVMKDRTMNNWLKLNRSILTSSVFDNPKLLKVWIWCLCKASHKPHDQVVGQQVQHLEAGQFIFGRHTASEELKIRHFIKVTITDSDNKSDNKPTTNRQQTDNKPTQTRRVRRERKIDILICVKK